MMYLSWRSALTEVHTLTEDTVNVLLILPENYLVAFPIHRLHIPLGLGKGVNMILCKVNGPAFVEC